VHDPIPDLGREVEYGMWARNPGEVDQCCNGRHLDVHMREGRIDGCLVADVEADGQDVLVVLSSAVGRSFLSESFHGSGVSSGCHYTPPIGEEAARHCSPDASPGAGASDYRGAVVGEGWCTGHPRGHRNSLSVGPGLHGTAHARAEARTCRM